MSAHHVVVVGAGFGGTRDRAPAWRRAGPHHDRRPTQPPSVSAPSLSGGDRVARALGDRLAHPASLSRRRDVTTLLASVASIDKDARELRFDDGSALSYDTLVLATGARHAYFGHDSWEPFAPGLKTLEDATTIRGRILLAFEKAEREEDGRKRAALMTFAIVGAGPTGVELAGAIAELARATLPADFRRVDTREARIVLIEAGPRVLPAFAEDLSKYAEDSLDELGVEVVLGQPVSECTAEGVVFGGRLLAAATILWAAGVQSSPAARWLDAPADRVGRLKVEPDLTVPGQREIFAIGDAAIVLRPDGRPVPGIAPAAKQEGAYVARAIRARLRDAPALSPFRYKHAGDLATIGKRRAVIDFGWIKLKGALAWWLWGFAHIYFLIGVRNRLSVAINWLWIYARDQRGARLITWWGGEEEGTAPFPRDQNNPQPGRRGTS